MKIGLDAKRAFFNDTGLGQYSRTLINDFEEFMPGQEFKLFSPKLPASLPKYKSEVVSPKNKRLFWRSYGLKKEVIEQGVDIYHGLSNEIPFFAHQNTDCKFVVTIHDLIPLKFPEWYPFIDAKIYKAKMRYACKHADIVVAISEHTRSDILRLGLAHESKVELIYQSVSQTYRNVELSVKPKVPYLLYVGSFTARKNILFLLDLFAELKAQIPHQLILVGSGRVSYLKKMQAIIEKKGLVNRIKLLSDISNAALPKYYNGADLFLYPSQYEGFGLPVAESIACGTAVVSTVNTSMQEAGGSGALFLPLEKQLWKEAILDLLDNEQNRKQMVDSGQSYIQKFEPQRVVGMWEKLYKELK